MWPAIAEGFGVAAFARFATIGVYRLAKPLLAKRPKAGGRTRDRTLDLSRVKGTLSR
jgi:hypothetical protein